MAKKRGLLGGFLYKVKEVNLGDVVLEICTLVPQVKCHMQGVEYEYLLSSSAQPAVLTALSPDITNANT